MGDSDSMRDGVTKKTKPKKIALEPKLTSLDNDSLQIYRERVTAFANLNPSLKLCVETIQLQFVSKCLDANGDELCILPYEGQLHQFKLEKRKLDESIRKSLLQGTRERTSDKKQVALVCPTTNVVVAVRINPPKSDTIKAAPEKMSINLDDETHSSSTRRDQQMPESPPQEIVIIDSSDEDHSCQRARKIKVEKDADLTASTTNKRKKKR